jgi:tRNA threonylcarbamoyladenosine biosynthesis protein TsaE
LRALNRRELHLATYSPVATQKLAATVAGALRPGDVVSLTGELGAGKTCFVQGAAEALGVAERVTSPSFLLRREYAAQIPIVHLDIYRLDTLQQVIDIGYDELVDRARVTFIEWGDAMSPLLPASYLEVDFRLGDPSNTFDDEEADAEERKVTLRARGDEWARRLAALAADLQPWHLVGREGAD